MLSPKCLRNLTKPLARNYKVLSIETSCDDTCVSILDRFDKNKAPSLLYNQKVTLDSLEAGGIIPTRAHVHHQQKLGLIVQQALSKVQSPMDVVCVARGPGMPGALSVGLDLAKGLSVAWNKPLIGVHHMLGHLLIPRMNSNGKQPQFPFLSLLVSGGHTMLVLSKSVVRHRILCDTLDIAIGDSLDKCAREIGIRGNMIAKQMEAFINEDIEQAHNIEYQKITLPNPLTNKNDRINLQAFSFSPFITAIKKHLAKDNKELTEANRRNMAYQIQEAIFNHLLKRLNVSISQNADSLVDVKSFVCSGGVSANMRLREKLENELPREITTFYYPELDLCTDNSVMIGWAGIELYEGYNLKTDLSCTPIRKWPVDSILDVPGWIH